MQHIYIELKPPIPMEATKAVRTLRNFVMSFGEPGARGQESLCSLSMMEDAFLTCEIQLNTLSKYHMKKKSHQTQNSKFSVYSTTLNFLHYSTSTKEQYKQGVQETCLLIFP